MVGFTARRTARISSAKLGQRPKQDTLPLPVDLEPVKDAAAEPINKQSMAFRTLASKNPELNALVAALDLVEVDSRPIRPEPLPAVEERIPTEPENPKLRAIAQRSFARCRTYSEPEAIERISSVTDVSTDRARNGLAMMYDQCIVSRTLSNEYYLTESTPF